MTIHQFTDAETCFREVKSRFDKVFTSHLEESAKELYSMELTGSIALVFGNERTGVSDHIRKLADGDFVIPQVGMIKSLNISVACAVSLYEVFRQRSLAGHYNDPKLDAHRRANLEAAWGLPDQNNVE